MLEFFRDPAWQFVGVVLAVAALAATFLVFWLQRQRKTLSYEVISKNQLLTVREELEGRLQVLYDGHPARDICLLIVKFVNSGNVPVSTTDYERPLSLSTGITSKILSAVITDVDPENLAASIDILESRVTLKPILLNSKDSVTLKLIVSDFDCIVVDGRVLGVKSVDKVGQTTGYHALLMIFTLACFALGAYLVISFTPKPDIRPPSPIQVKVGMVLFVLGYLTMFIFLGKNRALRATMVRVVRVLRFGRD